MPTRNVGLTEQFDRFVDESIESAPCDLADVPERVGDLRRDELGSGIHTYHVLHSRERARSEQDIVRQPRHLVVFGPAAHDLFEIERMLRDAMDLKRHLPSILGTNDDVK